MSLQTTRPSLELRSPVTQLNGVGPAIQKRLQVIGITQVYQLLFHFPIRYDDFSQVITIDECVPDATATLCGEITKITSRRSWKRRGLTLVEAELTDDTGHIKVVWYNQPFIAEQLPVGTRIYVSGKVVKNKYGVSLNGPTYEKYKEVTTHTARLVPVYPLTKGITGKQMRYFVQQALKSMEATPDDLPDWVPTEISEAHDILPLNVALQKIHFPDSAEDIAQAQFRLGFEELLLVHLFVLSTKLELEMEKAVSIPLAKTVLQQQIKLLPFTLTEAQRVALWEIVQDLNIPTPMNRLLEGDVGSGKTVVAALTMLNVVQAGYQAALMAPTELLARQHYTSIRALLPDTISVALLTGSEKMPHADADIIIGTHALIQDSVQFKKLALAIIDEQHRFGVAQRQKLQQQSGDTSTTPHLLSTTATPIPRTLALTIYGDLELSILNELPAGRKPIKTQHIKTSATRTKMYAHVTERLAAHEQVYVVAPHIEDQADDDNDMQSGYPYGNDTTANPAEGTGESQTKKLSIPTVVQEYKRLKKQFPEARLAQLHGKLPAKEKNAIMQAFNDGEIDILVSTTVIEVGVDVPNATVMIIEGADRFGLAQLHQLRGRVGRSDQQAFCYVCPTESSLMATKRLDFFCKNTDGFVLAEYDLERRGPGAVYGKSQSGFFQHFKMARLTDVKLIAASRSAAETILANLNTYPSVKKRLQKFSEQLHLE